jgi:hypothetical protein
MEAVLKMYFEFSMVARLLKKPSEAAMRQLMMTVTALAAFAAIQHRLRSSMGGR